MTQKHGCKQQSADRLCLPDRQLGTSATNGSISKADGMAMIGKAEGGSPFCTVLMFFAPIEHALANMLLCIWKQGLR